MRSVSDFIDGDWLSAAIVVYILYWAGSLMVRNRPVQCLRGQRLSGLAFIACVAWEAFDARATQAEQWVVILLHGVLAAALVLGLSWIALTVLEVLYGWTLGPIAEWGRAKRTALRRRREQRQRDREERQRQRQQAEAYERSAPERERARLQAEQDARSRTEAQRRRVAARKNALLAYSLYVTKVGDAFPRTAFDQYVAEYMSDGLTPEDVERGGLDLVGMLEKQVRPPAPDTTIESLSVWYAGNLTRLENLPLDDRSKHTLTVDLKRQFNTRLRRLLQENAP